MGAMADKLLVPGRTGLPDCLQDVPHEIHGMQDHLYRGGSGAGTTGDLRGDLRPVGVVRSPIKDLDSMPQDGVDSIIEIFPEYQPALLGIEKNTHIMIVGWLHEAERHRLQMRRPNHGSESETRGVFACRSPVRPNPLGVTTVRLSRVESRFLYVKNLDFVDGTPVLDVKPHAAGFDGAFAARCGHDFLVVQRRGKDRKLLGMVREAENFHGKACAGIAVGARLVDLAMDYFGIPQKDPGLVVKVGADGCIADALQALTGATFGNGRLGVSGVVEHIMHYGAGFVACRPLHSPGISVEEALEQPMDSLVEIHTW